MIIKQRVEITFVYLNARCIAIPKRINEMPNFFQNSIASIHWVPREGRKSYF